MLMYKYKNRNEGDRDGKSVKRSATRKRYRDGHTYYEHSLQLHYRQFLLFTDLPSLPPSFHEMIYFSSLLRRT